MLRNRKSPSGISGEPTRASTVMKTAKSATAPASRPIVVPEVQPFSLPLMTAYVPSITAAVTVTAPVTSRRRSSALPESLGSNERQATKTAIPMGRLTRKIQFQANRSVSTPPRSTPAVPPPESTKPKMPIALARSAGSVKIVMISESATTDTMAPPKPCTALATTRNSFEPASPQASEVAVNSARPMRNSRRRPNRSLSRPPSKRKPPKVSR